MGRWTSGRSLSAPDARSRSVSSAPNAAQSRSSAYRATRSALLTFELFARPALLKMAGRTKLHRPRVQARLLDRLDKPAGLRMFARGIYDESAGTVRSTGPQGSGILRSMSIANSLIDLPEPISSAGPGDTVSVVLTDRPEDH